MKKVAFAFAALAVLMAGTTAEARSHRHHKHHGHRHHRHVAAPAQQPGMFSFFGDVAKYDVPSFGAPSPVRDTARRIRQSVVQALPHPAGCPRIAFCGCGAAQELGLHDRSLWLAASWYKFPRSQATPGAAMVRPHHVAILKQHIEGTKWLVVDHNAGHHRSVLHVRDTAGWTIVRPRG